jgi:hypothetical protein
MQRTLIQGDSLNFRTTPRDYTADQGWVLTYLLVPRAGGERLEVETVADGASFLVQVPASVTAGWAVGDYSWAAIVTKAGDRYTVEAGNIQIKPNPAQATALDVRTQNEVALDAINAVLANRATMDQQNYAIGGRSLSRMPVADLLALRQHYVREIKRERGLQSRYVLGYR